MSYVTVEDKLVDEFDGWRFHDDRRDFYGISFEGNLVIEVLWILTQFLRRKRVKK